MKTSSFNIAIFFFYFWCYFPIPADRSISVSIRESKALHSSLLKTLNYFQNRSFHLKSFLLSPIFSDVRASICYGSMTKMDYNSNPLNIVNMLIDWEPINIKNPSKTHSSKNKQTTKLVLRSVPKKLFKLHGIVENSSK